MIENHYSLTLPSNSGWCETTWEIKGNLEIEGRRFLVAKVVFKSKFWNRPKLMRKNSTSLDLVEDYYLEMPQFLFAESQFEKVYNYLASWLQTPINQISNTPLNFVADLSEFTDYQFFEIKFGNSENRIVPLGQTECNISYESNAASGEFSYIVDQSCINIFFAGLEKYFSNRSKA